MGILDRIKSLVLRQEGEYRPGPYLLPITGGWLSAEVGSYWNWWQRGYDVEGTNRSAMIEACISAYSQTVAMLPGDHWWLNTDGGRERVTTSALSRILKAPNDYQTLSDFLLNLVDDLYSTGNAYALALRNSRFEIQELHLMNPRNCTAKAAPETGEIFYGLGGNEVVDYKLGMFPLIVPARDVLHIKLRTAANNMLLGESPIMSAARDIAAGDAMAAQQLQFYLNQARPSHVLTTDLKLSAAETQQLRDRWDEQSRGLNAGKTPILTSGIKPVTLSATADDSQLAEVMKMTQDRIALAFRVPLQLLGISGSPAGSTEALMQTWLAESLGFCLNHVETAFDKIFGLRGYPDEYTEFDTSALLRTEMKNRVEAFARGVLSGIFSPNEARAEFGYKKMPFGDEPRVQQQVVPLSAASGIPSAPPAPSPPAAPSAPKDNTNVNQQSLITGPDLLTASFEFDQRRAVS